MVVDDQLWAVIEPLLPVKTAGTPEPARMNDQVALQRILSVLVTGIRWEDLPQELGFRSWMARWRRLRDWQAAGAFEAMHQDARALQPLGIDRGRSRHPRQPARAGRGESVDTGPSLVDRRKTGHWRRQPPDAKPANSRIRARRHTHDVEDLHPAESVHHVKTARGRPRTATKRQDSSGPPRLRQRSTISNRTYLAHAIDADG
ncbi:transposase [Nocardia mangyaensis]|uniref:transposase n=1 Tax=Nocardia mangyaensis TaxID=2213200 RepID=UPI0009036489